MSPATHLHPDSSLGRQNDVIKRTSDIELGFMASNNLDYAIDLVHYFEYGTH